MWRLSHAECARQDAAVAQGLVGGTPEAQQAALTAPSQVVIGHASLPLRAAAAAPPGSPSCSSAAAAHPAAATPYQLPGYLGPPAPRADGCRRRMLVLSLPVLLHKHTAPSSEKVQSPGEGVGWSAALAAAVSSHPVRGQTFLFQLSFLKCNRLCCSGRSVDIEWCTRKTHVIV